MLRKAHITLAVLAVSATPGSSAAAAMVPGRAEDHDTWILATEFSGTSFFDNFTTYTGADPTNGHVKYTNTRVAAGNRFAGFTPQGHAFIGVDDQNAAPAGRQSLRLTSRQTVSVGTLSIFDIYHIPTGCGTWPALWYLGSTQTWPAAGEADIIETVNGQSYSAQTLHTSPGCSVGNTTSAYQGVLSSTDCNNGNGGLGCSIAQSNNNNTTSNLQTAGSGFNANGGGIYAHEWRTDGMTVWFFPRGAIPSDISSGTPDPQSWTAKKPLAKFSGGGCEWSSAFQEMQLIINTDFCGDWAGKQEVWESSGCAAKTGSNTCDAWVANNPKSFDQAFWEIASIKIYTSGSSKLGTGPDPNAASKRDVAAFRTKLPRDSEGIRAVSDSMGAAGPPHGRTPVPINAAKSNEASSKEVACWWVAALMLFAAAALM